MNNLPHHSRAEAEIILRNWRLWSKELSKPPAIVDMIKGGLTNCNWLLRSDVGDWVLRVNHPNSTALGIDRIQEQKILSRVATINLGPTVIYSDPELRYQITSFIPGTVWHVRHLKSTDNQRRLQSLIASYQQLEVPCEPRNYLDYFDNYRQQLSTQALELSEWQRYDSFYQQLVDMGGHWPKPQLCHHDLVPANIIETPDKLYLLDWEYAAPGCGELDYLAIGFDQPFSPLAKEMNYWLNRLWYLVQG